MEIIRATLDDQSMFTHVALSRGACCFYTPDREHRYVFSISGTSATLETPDEAYIAEVIEAFLFYSGFIERIENHAGAVLFETTREFRKMPLADIQPSQFFIDRMKLLNCMKWLNSPEDLYIPIIMKDGKVISLDAHTRMRAALDKGIREGYVYLQEVDDDIFHFSGEAERRGITSVSDMELCTHEEYALKWDKYCDDYFAGKEG